MCDISELSVLVVDGEQESRDDMCDALRELGLNDLLCAESTMQAIEHMVDAKHKKKELNFLFCNWNIKNGMTAELFINAVTNKYPHIITVMYSSCDKPEMHIKSMLIGSMEFIEMGTSFKVELFEKMGKWISLEQKKIDFRGSFNDSRIQPA